MSYRCRDAVSTFYGGCPPPCKRVCYDSQNIAFHFHPLQLGPEPPDFHLLGADRFAIHAFMLDLALYSGPVEQRLVNHAQHSGCRCGSLAAFKKPDRLLLEFKRVARH